MSWDAALDEIADRFQQIIADYGVEAIMPCSYLGHEGLLNGLTVGDASSIVWVLPLRPSASPAPALLLDDLWSHGTDPDTFRHPSTSFSGAVMH